MKECSKKRLVFVCLLITCMPLAGPSIVNASIHEISWQAQLKQHVLQHPAIVAVKEKMNAAETIFSGSNKPIYNPEISTNVEREGSLNNYRIGIAQTFDWQGKVAVRKKLAAFKLQAAKASFQMAVQIQTADTLSALVSWQAASQQAVLARVQEVQLDTMLALIDERQKNGDVGEIDAELTVLGLTKQLNATASAEATLKKFKAMVDAALPEFKNNQRLIPETFWGRVLNMSVNIDNMSALAWLEEHPAVLVAKADFQKTKSIAKQVKQNANGDPTVGINAGKTGDNNVLGFSLSLPLNIRNNYSAELKAARQEILSAEAEYYAVRRQQKRFIESSLAVLQVYESRIHRWRQLMIGRGERGGELINQQWQSGDLSTSEYLLVMLQISESLSAGIELEKQFNLARIDWLLQTGQLNAALTSY